MWRPRQPNGKWRFILKDLDFGLGIWDMNPVTHNAMRYNTENNNDDRKLFNALLTQDSFRKKFYGRFAVYMGDLLHYKSTSQVIDSIQQLLEPAMQDHLTRWMPEMWWRDMNSWRYEVAKIKTWCNQRNAEMYKHLQEFFQLGTITPLVFEMTNDLPEKPAVFINGIRMRDSGLNASYFQKEIIELHYEENNPQYGWEIMQVINGTVTVETSFQQDLFYQIAEGCSYVRIRMANKPSSLTKLAIPEISLSVVDHHLQISELQCPSGISIYDMSGKLLIQTTATDRSIRIPFPRKGIFIVKVQNEVQKLTEKVVIV